MWKSFVYLQLVMTTDVLMPVLQRVGITVGVPLAMKYQAHNHGSIVQKARYSLQAQSFRAEGIEPNPTLQAMQYVPSAVEQAVTSVVLITIGDGAWASGIILNKTGLILTNAHLLEPWRFGKTKISQSPVKGRILNSHDSVISVPHCCVECQKSADILEGKCSASCPRGSGFGFADASAWPVDAAPKNYQRIRVRLDHRQPRTWHVARPVYVSQGPLDIALLQLESPPPGLCPITPEKESPTPGSTAVVLGHGLFGPRSGM